MKIGSLDGGDNDEYNCVEFLKIFKVFTLLLAFSIGTELYDQLCNFLESTAHFFDKLIRNYYHEILEHNTL